MAKANKVEVQKGEIKAHQPTLKSMTRAEINSADAKDQAGRRDGMILKPHMPKQ